MAALFANTSRMDLSEALGSIGELKGIIANELRGKRFTDVVDTQLEVAGNRSGVRVSVLHLFIGGRSFWQVVMAGGDAADTTQETVNEVVDAIKKLKFF
ncbi:MAG TPA: hypothetical protein VE641_20020 [Chthoniobacterales bacterium]|nr:hypothetical protein [Chthoniobacterales bacterium]